MSVLRDHAQTLDDGELLAIWKDADDWERQGHITKDSELAGFRSYVTRGGLTNGHPMDSPALWLTAFVSEVYREVARRGLTPPS